MLHKSAHAAILHILIAFAYSQYIQLATSTNHTHCQLYHLLHIHSTAPLTVYVYQDRHR